MPPSYGWRACNATTRGGSSSVSGCSACRPRLGLMSRNNTIVARWFRAVNPDQGCLLPADVRSWLPPDHLCWQVIAVTGELDLSRFAAAYRAAGAGPGGSGPVA